MSDEPISIDVSTSVAGHVAVLASGTPREQKAAREALVALGTAALPGLVAAYQACEPAARYELVRVVAEFQHPSTAALLVGAVAGDDEDVRFIAADGLVGLEVSALDSLLVALRADPENEGLRDGALHVLSELAQSELGPVLEPVVTVLAGGDGATLLVHACKASTRALAAWRAEAA